MRVDVRRMPNRDLEEFVDLLLGTGMREGEGLAIRPIDLTGLPGTNENAAAVPVLHVRGTPIEPRKGYVDNLHRQDTTKTGEYRRLILPDHVAQMLVERMRRQPPATPESPIFGIRTGNWISPANMRTRLRLAIERALEHGEPADKELDDTSLHTLRRTVGTLLAHQVSLDAARDQLGQSAVVGVAHRTNRGSTPASISRPVKANEVYSGSAGPGLRPGPHSRSLNPLNLSLSVRVQMLSAPDGRRWWMPAWWAFVRDQRLPHPAGSPVGVVPG